ncbi:hypothetical protein ACSHWO_31060 [Streptomyces sp. HUAS TT3]|uniref:hypothetical protein n=1 Tax=Streptomyces sp. HUAS TT3 TaxID=3447510 RepID=UPI003F65A44E
MDAEPPLGGTAEVVPDQRAEQPGGGLVGPAAAATAAAAVRAGRVSSTARAAAPDATCSPGVCRGRARRVRSVWAAELPCEALMGPCWERV